MECNCNTQKRQGAFEGTLLKYKIEITAEGFDQDEDDFEVDVRRGSQSVTIRKADMVHTQEGWFLLIDTSALGPGKYEVITRAFVPDGDAPEGLRAEVDKQTLILVNNV